MPHRHREFRDYLLMLVITLLMAVIIVFAVAHIGDPPAHHPGPVHSSGR